MNGKIPERELSALTRTIAKYPVPFVTAVIAVLLFFTVKIVDKKDDKNEANCDTWKELYMQERTHKDIIYAAYLKEKGINTGTDSTLRNHTEKQAKKILENEHK